MGANNKQYLDLVGLQKLAADRRLNPTTTAVNPGAYKIGVDDRGHVVVGAALTAADFGVDKALRFVGISTTDPTTGATVAGYTAFKNGDVCIYQRAEEDGYEEYIYVTGHGWELLGDADSYLLANVFNEFKADFEDIGYSGDDYVEAEGTGKIKDGVEYKHKAYTAASAAPVKVGRDAGGHVVFGGALSTVSAGAHTHDVTVDVPADTFVVNTSDTKTHLDIKPTTDKAIKTIPGAFRNLEVTSIIPVGGSTTASKATAGTAKSVATVDTAKRYGTANVGTAVTGLAKRAASATTVGNANRATTGTRYGTANVGSKDFTVAGTGTAVTVATKGNEVVYGTANVGETKTVATRAATATTVGNANVGEAVRYGTANVGSASFAVAEPGANVTVATKGSEVVYGTADVGSTQTVATRAATASNFVTSVSVGAPTINVTNGDQVFSASIAEETLTLTPITISVSASAPTVTAPTGSIYGAAGTVQVTSAKAADTTRKITGVGGTTTVKPAVAKTITVATAVEADDDQTLTPAVASSTSIYGTAGTVTVTSATAAPTTQKITGVGGTASITPAVSKTITVAVAEEAPNTQVIYEAIASTESIYGVTADQVSIAPAVEAPDTQTIVPAKANGTITPYTFANVTVPVAAAAVTVATGDLSTSGEGDAVMTGLGTITTIDALTDAELVSGSTGVAVVTNTSHELNGVDTLAGTAASNGGHTHTIQ